MEHFEKILTGSRLSKNDLSIIYKKAQRGERDEFETDLQAASTNEGCIIHAYHVARREAVPRRAAKVAPTTTEAKPEQKPNDAERVDDRVSAQASATHHDMAAPKISQSSSVACSPPVCFGLGLPTNIGASMSPNVHSATLSASASSSSAPATNARAVQRPLRDLVAQHDRPTTPEIPDTMSPTFRNEESDHEYEVLPVTVDDGEEIMPMEAWQDRDIEMCLDSGCCNHVLDAEDAPGYLVSESPGSRRGQNFVVGNGQRVPNEGQVRLRMEASTGEGSVNPVQSIFQVAEVSRPLMSVSKICDQGYSCLFTKDSAQILDANQRKVCEFGRSNGLYVANMKLKSPEPFQRPAA